MQRLNYLVHTLLDSGVCSLRLTRHIKKEYCESLYLISVLNLWCIVAVLYLMTELNLCV